MEIIDKKKLKEILEKRHKESNCKTLSELPRPNFKDIEKASKRIKKAINNKEKIVVVGDYDVDGIISTTIIFKFFKKIGYELSYIIPNRFTDGYGISTNIINKLDCDLIITVDNGISAIEASKRAKEKNIDLIITDHHTIGEELPLAYAIINPKQKDCPFPYKDICGAVVVWYLCSMIKKELNLNIDLKEYLDLLAIATIADVMPMIEFNYTITRYGLRQLLQTKHNSLKELVVFLAKDKILSDDIGFLIAPILNSAGRMSSADIALDFLLEENSKKAFDKLQNLIEINNIRKEEQSKLIEEVIKNIDNEKNAIIVYGENWHEGIIGIVASRLSSIYNKPTFVFSINNNIAKGSCRNNTKLNLFDILNQAKNLLIGFGGHKDAAGLSLKAELLDKFKEKIYSIIDSYDDSLKVVEQNNILGEVDVKSIDFEFLNILEYFDPFGYGNNKPLFLIKNAKIIDIFYMGNNKHVKLTLEKEIVFEVFDFNFRKDYKINDILDFVVCISRNDYKNNIQMIVR